MTVSAPEQPREPGEGGYRTNTNLEQISDWLTKILVGVGLVQLGRGLSAAERLAGSLGPPMGNVASSPAAGLAIVLTYAVLGFLYGYIWTRLYLKGAFSAADLRDIARDVIDKQQSADAVALALVNRLLDPPPGVEPVTQDKLSEAVKAASPPTRVVIFERGRAARKAGKIDESILLFRALIAADPEDRFHRNHGQLGYALMAKSPPDWKAAEQALSKAISIRDAAKASGFRLYEGNRAICRIRLDPNFPERPADPETRAAILADLEVAARHRFSLDRPQS